MCPNLPPLGCAQHPCGRPGPSSCRKRCMPQHALYSSARCHVLCHVARSLYPCICKYMTSCLSQHCTLHHTTPLPCTCSACAASRARAAALSTQAGHGQSNAGNIPVDTLAHGPLLGMGVRVALSVGAPWPYPENPCTCRMCTQQTPSSLPLAATCTQVQGRGVARCAPVVA